MNTLDTATARAALHSPGMRKSAPPSHYDTIAGAIRWLTAHAREQPDLAALALAVGLSEHHLQRVFSEWAGVSPKRFLQYLTKEHALAALTRSADVLDASLEAGLSGPGRLHDLMVSTEAMTPGEIRQRGETVTITWGCAPTPFGPAFLASTARGLCALEFDAERPTAALARHQARWPAADWQRDDDAAAELAARIFSPAPRGLPLPLHLKGTNFQLKVWEALLRTAPGDLVSYGQVARALHEPQAARAVGAAVGANALAYLIPCHRVIRESGDFNQYRWGIERKLAMLGWEAAA